MVEVSDYFLIVCGILTVCLKWFMSVSRLRENIKKELYIKQK